MKARRFLKVEHRVHRHRSTEGTWIETKPSGNISNQPRATSRWVSQADGIELNLQLPARGRYSRRMCVRMFSPVARCRLGGDVRNRLPGDSCRCRRTTTLALKEHTCRKMMQSFRQPGRPCVMTGRVKKFDASTGSRCQIFSSRPSRRTENSTIPLAYNFAAFSP